MKQRILPSCSVIFIILFILAAACVAPPESTGEAGSGSGSAKVTGAKTTVAAEETTPMYVTVVTPYGYTVPTTAATPAPTPTEEWVKIYSFVKQNFSYNITAVAFNLKNPPMLINFSLKPVNVTGTKVIITGSGTNEKEEKIKYDYYSPYSWFEVTVRNKDTGQVLLQDGFGNSYGRQYPSELNRTVKVNNRGDLLIEMNGNLITASLDLKVKKEGNVEGNITGS